MLRGIELLQETLNRFKSDVNAMIQEGDEDALIDEDALLECMAGQPRKLLRWGTLAARAERIRDDFAAHLETLRYSCQALAREKLAKANEKVTEERVKEVAYTMAEYQQAQQAAADALELYRYLQKIEKSIQSRDEHLKNVNYRQCRELDGYPRDAEGQERDASPRLSLAELQAAREQQLRDRYQN